MQCNEDLSTIHAATRIEVHFLRGTILYVDEVRNGTAKEIIEVL